MWVKPAQSVLIISIMQAYPTTGSQKLQQFWYQPLRSETITQIWLMSSYLAWFANSDVFKNGGN